MLDGEIIEEMQELSDREFIQKAYKTILLRKADDDGIRNYLGILSSGISRDKALFYLRISEEGFIKNVHIKNLKVGSLQLKGLLEIGDYEVFILATYLAILGRTPNDTEKKLYLYKLITGRYNKIDVIEILKKTNEGKLLKTNIIGLEKVEKRRRLRKQIYCIPVLGKIASSFWELIHLENILNECSQKTEYLMNMLDKRIEFLEQRINNEEHILNELKRESKGMNSKDLSVNQMRIYDILNGEK